MSASTLNSGLGGPQSVFVVVLFLNSLRCGGRVDSAVGIAPGYGLDGPGSNPGGGEIFRTGPGPTQPPVQCVPGISRG
jgi:hypothetical protein